MIDKLVADQKKLVDEVWQRRAPDLPLANIEDFVTLASIVEKETGRGTSVPASPPSSSTGWPRACACNPIRPSSMVCSAVRKAR